VSTPDVRLSVLSKLDRARDGAVRASCEIILVKRELRLLGLEMGGLDRALDAITVALQRTNDARDKLQRDMRSNPCA